MRDSLKLKGLVMALIVGAVLAGPAMATSYTMTTRGGTGGKIEIEDRASEVVVRFMPPSLAPAGADTARGIADLRPYVAPAFNSSGAPIYTVYMQVYGWTTGVDSTRCGTSMMVGERTTSKGGNVLYSMANTGDNFQRPTAPDKLHKKTLTLSAVDFEGFLEHTSVNADATSAGSFVVEYRFPKPNPRPR